MQDTSWGWNLACPLFTKHCVVGLYPPVDFVLKVMSSADLAMCPVNLLGGSTLSFIQQLWLSWEWGPVCNIRVGRSMTTWRMGSCARFCESPEKKGSSSAGGSQAKLGRTAHVNVLCSLNTHTTCQAFIMHCFHSMHHF